MHHQNAVESLSSVCFIRWMRARQLPLHPKRGDAECNLHVLLWRSKSLENYIEAPGAKRHVRLSLHSNNVPQVWKNLVNVLFGALCAHLCVCVSVYTYIYVFLCDGGGGASREIRRWSLGQNLRRAARIGYPHHVVRINLLPFPYKRKPQIYSRCVCVSPWGSHTLAPKSPRFSL